MALSRRETAILVGGLLLGVAGAWALFAGRGGDDTPGKEVVSQAGPRKTAPAPASAMPAPRIAIAPDICAFPQILPSAGDGDGAVPFDKDPAGQDADAVSALLVTGKESAASGHRRDAESAFLMACRVAGKLSGDGMALADAVYRLGRHYAMVESAVPRSLRDEVHARARTLHATSLQAYRAHHGEEHERTRFAATGLAALKGTTSDAKTVTATTAPKAEAEAGRPAAVQPAAKAPAVAARPAAPREAPAVVAAPRVVPAPAPTPAAPTPARAEAPREAVAVSARRARPSFDCARARSTTEQIICADDDLARQDRELGGLHARAKAAAPDQRAFQRRSDAEWSRREATCTDSACLQRWYAQRREQLSAEIEPAPRAIPARVAGADREPVRRARVEVAPAVGSPMDASVGQATGDVGDTSQ